MAAIARLIVSVSKLSRQRRIAFEARSITTCASFPTSSSKIRSVLGYTAASASVVAGRTLKSPKEAHPIERQKRVTLGWLTPARSARSPIVMCVVAS